MKINLPHNWTPRAYQESLWNYLGSGGKRAVVAWHRRSGKDAVMLHHVACSAFERIGNYWYMLPQYGQARKALWDAVNPHTGAKRMEEAFPKEIRRQTYEQEMKIALPNGSTFQVIGSDNFDSLVGSTPVGLVFSEYALSNPSAWGFLRPILLENNGWACFNSTPRGKNHFKALFDLSQTEPGWFSQLLTAQDTGIFTPEQLQAELREMQAEHGDEYGKALWLQEYFCSFDAAQPGAIWADCLVRAKAEQRIGKVEHEPGFPVFTGWDLGYDDDTAVWFYQVIGAEIRVIDYFDDRLKDIEYYANMLKVKAKTLGYEYGTHWLPHDARPRTLAAGGKSILQQLLDCDIGRCAIAPRLDVEEGIQAARATFPNCWFDEDKTAKGRDYLIGYRRTWDEEKRVFSSQPLHDFCSHACLVAGSIVKTERGDIPIENVVVGDRAWTPAGYAEVENAGPVKVSDTLIEISTTNGNLVCTPEHKILTKRGFVCADALEHNDTILTGEELSCVLSTLISMVTGSGFRATITGETLGGGLGHQTFIGRFGSFITEKFRKAMMFITLMETRSTMTYQTCPSLSGSRINGNMQNRELEAEACFRQEKRQEDWLQNGMAQKREGNGTLSTEREHGKTGSRKSANALTAVLNSIQRKRLEQSGAAKDANSTQGQRRKAGYRDPNGNPLSAFARNVAKSLCRLFLSAQCTAIQIAQLKRLEGDKGRKLVFDLTVKKHGCYQANGMLVSNSDAWRTVAVTWRRSKVESREISPQQKLMAGNVTSVNFGQIKEAHMRRMRAAREM